MKIKISKEDQIFSEYIRTRDNWTCARCGRVCKVGDEKLYRLDCSHFWGRANQATRYDEENADAHCFTCHNYLGANPHEFREWKLKQLGAERYKALERRARSVKKWKPKEKEELIKSYQEKIKKP
jgi:hypothetical protein